VVDTAANSVAVAGTSLSTGRIFVFARPAPAPPSILAEPGLGGPCRHLDRRLSSNRDIRRRAARAPLPVRLRRSLRLRAPLLSASIRSAADAPDPPKHHV